MKTVISEEAFLLEATKRGLIIIAGAPHTELPGAKEAVRPGTPSLLGGIWLRAALIEPLGINVPSHGHIGLFFDVPEDVFIVTYMGGP